MKIQIEATDRIVDLDGVKCRVWNGKTERGIECLVFVHRLAVRSDDDTNQFDQELQECLPLCSSITAIALRAF